MDENQSRPDAVLPPDSGNKEEKEQVVIAKRSYVLYYALLFFAYWFGADRFDTDGDGDFDAEDVHAWLENKGIIKNNYRRKIKKIPRAQSTATAGGSAAPEAATKAQPKAGAANPLDRNHDGIVDVADLVQSDIEGVIEEEHIVHNLTSQRPPLFILIESLAAFSLWAGFMLKAALEGGSNPMGMLAGLDSFFDRGTTTLRLSGPDCADSRYEVWRWWSYQFTHIGIAHVFMNCLLNFVLGIPLEGLHGPFRMAVMYNIGVFGGACAYMIHDAHTNVVGMSGGCYSLIGMHLADLIMNWTNKKFRKPTVLLIFTLIGVDVFTFVTSVSGDSVSHSAHVGGSIAGFIIGVVVGKNLDKTIAERVFQVFLLVAGLCAGGACLAWSFSHWGPINIWEAMRGENGWCWVKQVFLPDVSMTEWLCVRCGSTECIQMWNASENIIAASAAHCKELGFYHDGR